MGIETTVCATGHRPKDLPGGYGGNKALSEMINNIVGLMIETGYNTFISGGALGVDTYFADAVLLHKTFTPEIKLVIARPFPSQSCKWPSESQEHFNDICSNADEVVDVSPDPYSPAKMQIRNEWMVKHSGLVLVVWSGKRSGGTWNCIQSAQKLGRRLYFLNPYTLETTIQ